MTLYLRLEPQTAEHTERALRLWLRLVQRHRSRAVRDRRRWLAADLTIGIERVRLLLRQLGSR